MRLIPRFLLLALVGFAAGIGGLGGGLFGLFLVFSFLWFVVLDLGRLQRKIEAQEAAFKVPE